SGRYRRPVNPTGAYEPERIRAIVGSANLLTLLGAVPSRGRGFGLEDEQWGSHRVALISDGLWRSRFGADPAVVGRTVGIDSQPHTIVGILPPGFSWLDSDVQLLLPMSFEPGDNLNSHNNYFMATRRSPTSDRVHLRVRVAGVACRRAAAPAELIAGILRRKSPCCSPPVRW